jgi:1-deoxy-D-xylulose-5-phosphate synthase
MVDYSIKAADILALDGIQVEVINMRFVKPLDEILLDEIGSTHKKVITIEENSILGGFGSSITEYFADRNYKNDILRLGLPDKFIEHGTQEELHKQLELDPAGIAKQVKLFLKGQIISHKVVA